MKTLQLALATALLATASAHATTILHNFAAGSADGAQPFGSLTLVGSKLYGMTNQGGSGTVGTIFSVNPNGSGFSLLHTFTGGSTDGSMPYGSLALSGSKFYGMTWRGGSANFGTIFSMNTDGTGYTVLRSLTGGTTDGGLPHGSLTVSGSKLYGMTSSRIFSLNTDGTGFIPLHAFSGDSTDGFNAFGSLALSGSKLYGMTAYGGGNSTGTIFSVNTDGTGFALLHSFAGGSTDGSAPFGSLTLSGSKLYGTTYAGGGPKDAGTIFSLNTDGSGFGLLHSFLGGTTDGGQPNAALTLSGSKLYGTTAQGGAHLYGTIFSLNTDGSGYGVMQSLNGGPGDGENPQGDVTLSADGQTLYGVAPGGGTASKGVIFSAPTGAPEPSAALLLAGAAFPLLLRRRRG